MRSILHIYVQHVLQRCRLSSHGDPPILFTPDHFLVHVLVVLLVINLLPTRDLALHLLIVSLEEEDRKCKEWEAKSGDCDASPERDGIAGRLRLDEDVRGDEVGTIANAEDYCSSDSLESCTLDVRCKQTMDVLAHAHAYKFRTR